MMPFAHEWDPIFDAIRDTLQSPSWNFVCRRASDFFGGGHILTDILRGIGQAQIVIADLSGRNPNVFYELGITHMVKKPEEVVLLTQNMDSVPFDLRPFRCIEYSTGDDGIRKLKEDLARALRDMTTPIYRFSMKQRETYEFPNRLFGEDRCLYDFTIFADFLGVDGSKLTLSLRRYIAGHPSPDVLEPSYIGLGQGQSADLKRIPWQLRLELAGNESAQFSLVRTPRVSG